MRQLANGVSQFVDRNGSFPTALRYSRDFSSGGSAMSFFVEVLPFIGYELLYDTFFQFNNEVLLGRVKPGVFRCPSDIDVFTTGTGEQGRVNYRGSMGSPLALRPSPPTTASSSPRVPSPRAPSPRAPPPPPAARAASTRQPSSMA